MIDLWQLLPSEYVSLPKEDHPNCIMIHYVTPQIKLIDKVMYQALDDLKIYPTDNMSNIVYIY